MKSFVFCVVISLIGIYIFQVDGKSRSLNLRNRRELSHRRGHGREPCCPDYTIIKTNMSDPTQQAQSQLQLIESLWNNANPPLTPNGELFKKAILLMAKSDVPRWNTVAAIATGWLWTILPEYQTKPNYCVFVPIIELTLLPRNHPTYCQKLSKAIRDLNEFAQNTESYMLATTMKNAGCCPINIPETEPICKAKDSLNAARKIWELKGVYYPWIYQTASLKAYKSDNYMDQILGVIGTAILSEHLVNFNTAFDKPRLYLAFEMQFVGKIPEECCEVLKADAAIPYSNTLSVFNNTYHYVLQQAGCPP